MDWGKLAFDLSKKVLVALATGAASMAVSAAMNKLLGDNETPKTIETTVEPTETSAEEVTKT